MRDPPVKFLPSEPPAVRGDGYIRDENYLWDCPWLEGTYMSRRHRIVQEAERIGAVIVPLLDVGEWGVGWTSDSIHQSLLKKIAPRGYSYVSVKPVASVSVTTDTLLMVSKDPTQGKPLDFIARLFYRPVYFDTEHKEVEIPMHVSEYLIVRDMIQLYKNQIEVLDLFFFKDGQGSGSFTKTRFDAVPKVLRMVDIDTLCRGQTIVSWSELSKLQSVHSITKRLQIPDDYVYALVAYQRDIIFLPKEMLAWDIQNYFSYLDGADFSFASSYREEMRSCYLYSQQQCKKTYLEGRCDKDYLLCHRSDLHIPLAHGLGLLGDVISRIRQSGRDDPLKVRGVQAEYLAIVLALCGISYSRFKMGEETLMYFK